MKVTECRAKVATKGLCYTAFALFIALVSSLLLSPWQGRHVCVFNLTFLLKKWELVPTIFG